MDTKRNTNGSHDTDTDGGRFRKAPPAENILGAYTTTIADATIVVMLKLGVLGEDGHGSVGLTIRWLWLGDLCDQCGCDIGDVLDQFAENMSGLEEDGTLDRLPLEMRDVSETWVWERASARASELSKQDGRRKATKRPRGAKRQRASEGVRT